MKIEKVKEEVEVEGRRGRGNYVNDQLKLKR